MLKKGIPSTIRKRALRVAIGAGRRITKRESRYQKPASSGRASASARRRRKRGRERVDAGAQQRQHGGQHGERDRRGEQRHDAAAEPHRVEEALREDEQGEERRGDGQRGEEDGAAGGRQGAPHRGQAGTVLGDLLAVAGDDEEAVVDRQPEPEAGGQVEREDRDRADLAGDAQGEEGADDRQRADHQRQQRGDQASEEEQREQEEQREGQQLGHPQVLLDLLVDLLLRHRGTADRDPGAAGEPVIDRLGRVLPGLVLGRPQGDGEVGLAAVAGDEGARAGVVVAGHSVAPGGCGGSRARSPSTCCRAAAERTGPLSTSTVRAVAR